MAKRDGRQSVLAVGDTIVTQAVSGVVVSAEAGAALNGDPIVVEKDHAPAAAPAVAPAVGSDQAISDEAKMHAAELAETAAKVGKAKTADAEKDPSPPAAPDPLPASGARVEEPAAAAPAADKPPEQAPEPKPRNGTPGKKLEAARCPLCKGAHVPAKHGTKYATEGVTRYRQCSDCGQRFTTFTPWIQGKPGEPATPGKEDIVG